MLNHTKRIKEIYETIQKMIFYMIPEKWEKLYLYSSIIDMPKKQQTGELFFYYIPKGVIKKKLVNVYEIPNKFNIDEKEYLPLVEALYNQFKLLREEFRKADENVWSNITVIIHNARFRVEYDYENLNNSDYTSYERHIIWRYKYLGIGPEQVNKTDKDILKRYIMGAKKISRREIYEFGIYIKDINNIVDYTTDQNTVRVEEPKKPNRIEEPQKQEEKILTLEQEKQKEKQSLTLEEEIEKQRIENKQMRKNQILFGKELFENDD